MLSDVRGDEPDEHSESDDESAWWWWWESESDDCPPARGEPGTAAARDGLTEVPCGWGMRKVPSDDDDDGVPDEEEEPAAAEDGQLDGHEDLPVAVVLPDKFSSNPKRGRGNDMGRSRRADGRRGSVGGSSFSS